MPARNDIDGSKMSYRSYLAFVPIFKARRKSSTEINIVRLIQKSNIFKSNPILKTLLIENVRITCIVVESSGKHSVKILCASAPYILTLISKANPKFENFLKNEKISSCLKLLNESDFEYVISNVYHMTVILYNGVNKLYSTIYVGFIKDSIPQGEKLLLYLAKLILHVLQSSAEFISDNITFLFHYLHQQNYRYFNYATANFSNFIATFIKYSVIAMENARKSVFLGARYMKNLVLSVIHILKNYSDSTLCCRLKKLYFILKLSLSYIRTTDTYNNFEHVFLHLFHILKPYLWKYCIELFEALKHLMQIAIPYVKETLQTIVTESIPLIRKFIDDNWEIILNVYNATMSFLSENIQHVKPFCCRTCHILYDSICYVYNILKAILPRVIESSSNAGIFLITTSMYILEQCVYFCNILSGHIINIVESQRQNFCHLSKSAINILKKFCEIILKAQPYMVRFSRIIVKELTKVIHVLSPTLVASCIREVNSSVFYASKEVVGKSYLAVKRVAPSFYYSIKKVMPPTLLAIHELLKSSKNSVVIISPAVLKFALYIHPDIRKGFIILFSDGNKACIEIITMSFSASCQIKNAAVTVSSNVPLLCKAIHEVLITAAYATVEVKDKSRSAKSRMFKDIERARQVVQTSFVLAEQEVVTVYNDFICEVNTFLPKSEECGVNRTASSCTYFIDLFNCVSSSFVKSVKIASNEFDDLTRNSVSCIQKFSKLIVNVIFYAFFLAYALFADMIKPGVTKFNIMQRNCFTSCFHIFAINSYIVSSRTCILCNHVLKCISDSNIRIIQCVVAYIPETWLAFKYNVNAMWNKICLLVPELWTLTEYFASVFWNFMVEHTPGAWKAWKRFCFAAWKLTQDLTPHVWQYSSTTVSVIWPFGRTLTKQLWCLFTSSSSSTWLQIASHSFEYWFLSKTYLPRLWFTACKETKTTWVVACCLIETFWNITVETCSSSWNYLHCAVAKSWRNGVIFTKTAYCMLITTGSVLQRSVCVCSKTKKYVCVILKSTPFLVSDFSVNYFRISKLQKKKNLDLLVNGTFPEPHVLCIE